MKFHFHLFVIALLATLTLFSCSEEGDDVSLVNRQTMLVFMPWTGDASGNNGLYRYFLANLDSMQRGIEANNGLQHTRVLVFISDSPSSSHLQEFTYDGSKCKLKSLKNYNGNNYTSGVGIAQILNDVKQIAPALNYAMVIGSHGVGWTHATDWTNYPYNAKVSYTTRFFGSVNDTQYAIEIENLADGLSQSNTVLQYLLFDDCYMANAETAYALRHVTNFLVASTSEVLATGMPYYSMWDFLASGTPNYTSMTKSFHTFYSNYTIPCGALSVIDCRKMEQLAALMRELNAKDTISTTELSQVQVLDGFTTPLFYDCTSYVTHMNPAKAWLNQYNTVIKTVVRSTVHTDSIYSALYETRRYIKVNEYSGITISDPSLHPVAIKSKHLTEWWVATHPSVRSIKSHH